MEQRIFIDNFDIYGFRQAGLTGGDLESFKGYLDKIQDGYLVHQDDLTIKTDKEKALLQEKIDDLKSQIHSYKASIENKEGYISDKKKENERLNTEIDDISKESVSKRKHQIFSLSNLLTYLFFLLPLSTYLVFFYTAVAKSALYGLDPSSIIREDSLSIPILPQFTDLLVALQTNYMLLLVPFVFFAFGVVMHIFLEGGSPFKWLMMSSVILITLLADGFIAYKIHEQAIIAVSYIADEDEIDEYIERAWYKDTNFYLVLILGFVTFVMWSIIFHALKTEWSKRDIIRIRVKKIEKNQNDINKENNEIRALEEKIKVNEQKVDSYEEEKIIPKVSIQTLMNNISDFTVGWNKYISGLYADQSEAKKHLMAINAEKKIFLENIKSHKYINITLLTNEQN